MTHAKAKRRARRTAALVKRLDELLAGETDAVAVGDALADCCGKWIVRASVPGDTAATYALRQRLLARRISDLIEIKADLDFLGVPPIADAKARRPEKRH